MRELKIPQKKFALKLQGGLMHEGEGGCICGTLRYINHQLNFTLSNIIFFRVCISGTTISSPAGS